MVKPPTYTNEITNPRTYTQVHTPTVVQRRGGGGGGWGYEGVFDMLQYFETILPLVEGL